VNETVAAPTLASVVVLSIQDFGRKPVAEQIKLKTALETLVREAIGALSDSHRLVLDAPGGFAVVVLAAPSAALRLAERAQAGAIELALRIGLNHGPIKLVEDARRSTSLVGDGVGTSMMLANATKPGRMLVSRGFREALKIAASERVGELRSAGTITDPDVRTHETFTLDASVAPARRKRRLVLSLVGVGAIIGLGVAGRFAREHYDVQLPFAKSSVPLTPPAPSRAAAPSAPAPSRAAVPPPAPAPSQPVAPPPPAVVDLRIAPRGEIFVDGKSQGVSPPLARLELSPGTHTIEVRNSPHPAHRRQLTLEAGQTVRLRHTFQVAAPAPQPAPVAKPAPRPDEERTVGEFARDAADQVRKFGRQLGF